MKPVISSQWDEGESVYRSPLNGDSPSLIRAVLSRGVAVSMPSVIMRGPFVFLMIHTRGADVKLFAA